MHTIDTHVHLIDPVRFNYPWLSDVPELSGTWDFDRWSREAERAGVTEGIFMEVDVAESDMKSEAAHFRQTVADPSSRLVGVIAACRPEFDGFEAYLDAIESSHLVGLRRVLHVAPEGTLDSPHLVPNLRLLADHDLPFDLCLRADQLVSVLDLVDACPRTQFVLDHSGNPPVLTDGFDAWRSDIASLALRPNVVCKISGLVNHVPETEDPLNALQPVIDHVADRFGIHRLLFGGDWPVCSLRGFDLGDWADLARELVSSWSQNEQNSFFSGNARRLYGVI
ncbi:amidohydrolase family protein [Bacteroidota bacterium]